jgi:gamma-glutamylcyclotransferase (GGCT)/AIG2-like uncharacterized protein YtfP
MADLFAYGTLMCEDIMLSVAGAELQRGCGVIKGFKRFEVKNEHYPGITEVDGGEVAGIVYFAVAATAWQRLDRFEGQMYERREVEVRLDDGRIIPAYTYVVDSNYRDRLGPGEWNFDSFVRRGKEAFVNHYSGYGEID